MKHAEDCNVTLGFKRGEICNCGAQSRGSSIQDYIARTQPTKQKSQHTETDAAWCAGILEGEGWIYIASVRLKDRVNIRHSVRTGFVNSDLALLNRFADLWGGRIRRVKGTALTRVQCYEWRIDDKRAETFLRAIAPYVVGAKREKVSHALAVRDVQNSRKLTRKSNGTFQAKEALCLSQLSQ